MKKAIHSSELTLEDVQEMFGEWRKNKKWHDPIPDELWQAAVELTKKHPPGQVSKVLRLDSSTFKERVRAVQISEKPSNVSPSFIELNIPSSSAALSEYIVETEDTTGRKMRICIKGQPVDVIGLAKAFWVRET